MPALDAVTFVSTHAHGFAPTPLGDGVWDLKAPSNVETITANTVTTVDLHQTVDIPTGYIGLVGPATSADITGAADCFPVAFVVIGTGAAQALSVKVANVSVANGTPTGDSVIARLAIIKLGEYKHSTAGTWT